MKDLVQLVTHVFILHLESSGVVLNNIINCNIEVKIA